MIPTLISQEAADIAEMYWGVSWTKLTREQVEEALEWWDETVYTKQYSRWD